VGVAVSFTLVPVANACEHVEPQLIPVGLEPTAPAPAPDFVTVNVWAAGCTLTWSDLLPVRPPFSDESPSVTVSVTVFVPADAYV
jgi:hypothetical protein